MKTFWQKLNTLFKSSHDQLYTRCQILPFFKNFSHSEQQAFLRIIHLRNFADSEVIYEKGASALALFFVLSGSIGLYREGESTEMERYQTHGPGEVFGEEALLGKSHRMATVCALEATQVIGIVRSELEELMQNHSGLFSKILLSIACSIYARYNDREIEMRELTKRLTKANIIV